MRRWAKRPPLNYAGEAAQYAAAFDEDMRLNSLSTEAAAGVVNQRAIREELLAALADWSNVTPNKQDKERLRDICKTAEPDASAFRNRWNAAMAAKDLAGLCPGFRPRGGRTAGGARGAAGQSVDKDQRRGRGEVPERGERTAPRRFLVPLPACARL